MTLYELTDQLLALAEMAEDPTVDTDTLIDTMDAVEGEFEFKAEGYAKVLRTLEAQASALAAESDRMKKKADAITDNIKKIKERLKCAMEKTGKKDIRTDLFHMYVKPNKGFLAIDNPDAVPEKYLVKQPPKVNKIAIKEDLKNGEKLPWCHIEPTTSLIIR